MEQEVRYCTTEDGVRIAYAIEGQGYPLLWCPILVESFPLVEDVRPYGALMGELAKHWTLIRYDPRGVGLSERDVDDQSNTGLVYDIEAVVKASGVARLAVWANITSGPRAVTFAVRNAGIVSHLVLYDTFANPVTALPHATARALAEMARTNWSLAVETISGLGMRGLTASEGRLLGDYFAESARNYERSSSGKICAELLLQAYESWDVREILSEIRCPTLVIHHLENPVIAVDAGKELAAGTSAARFVAVAGAWATPWVDLAMGTDTLSRIKSFLPIEAAAATEQQGPLRTVLFTDLVGHSEMMSRLGDQLGREVLREHESITRKTLKEHAGAEVKTMGDGFMASFASVTKAVECAIALQKAFTERNESAGEQLNVRVGLNAGEPIEDEGDLFGATVILAARIAAKAEAGEILVADTVRGLCHGKGFVFQDRGEFVAKGFEEPVRVYNVRWNN